MDGGKLQQISTDHVFGGTAVGKAPLTQYLGLPEELENWQPSVTEIEHKEGIQISSMFRWSNRYAFGQ